MSVNTLPWTEISQNFPILTTVALKRIVWEEAIKEALSLERCPSYRENWRLTMAYLIIKGSREDWMNLQNFNFWEKENNESDKTSYFLLDHIAHTILWTKPESIFGNAVNSEYDPFSDPNNVLSSKLEYYILYCVVCSRLQVIKSTDNILSGAQKKASGVLAK